MSDALTLSSEALPLHAPGQGSRPLAERDLAILGRLAEAGLEIAVALEAQARGGPPVVQGDLAMAYNRVARAVRHTIMLRSRLIEQMRDGEDEAAGRKAGLGGAAARIVRGVIADETQDDAARAERLAREAAERLRGEDVGDLLTRPFREAVAGICRDLGLSPDWLALAEDCCAAETELLRKPGKGPGSAFAGPPNDPGALSVQWLAPGPDSS